MAVIFFITSAFMYGNTGFKIDKTQKGMLISKITKPVNQLELNDLIISAHGIPYHEILGFCLTIPHAKSPGTITVLRDSKEINFSLKTIPFSALSLFELIWPRLMLIVVCLTLGSIVLYKASHSHPPTLFFLMLCSMSTALAATIPSSIIFLSPIIFSSAFILHAFFNWIAFGLWLHFALRFPASRDLIRHRWWIPLCIYLIPAVTTFGGSLYAAGLTPEFWGWVQRLRNLYLPFIIIGVFVKHAIDYKFIQNQQEKNQIKLPLIAYWLTFAPYLFFYLLPNILVDTPFISFRTAVFAFFILPMAYFAGIIQYKLFDVDQIISRAIAYFATIMGLSIIYSLFFTVLQKWFFGEHVLSKELFLLFLILVNVVFHPVILRLDRLIRKSFFKHESIAIKTMHQLSNMISATLYLPDLIRMVIEDLPRAIDIKSTAVMILEKKRSRLFPENIRFGTTPWPKSRLITLFKDKSVEYFSTDLVTDDIKLKEELKEIQKTEFSLVIPLRGSQSLSAVLFIGPKNSGGHFHEEDIHLLASFANQAAIALENAIAHEALIESKKQLETIFNQNVQSEKMAAIGEMTSILAHELKNPLGIIHSSAQYLSEGKQSKAVTQEMLHYITNEVDHLNLSINSILKLAKQKAPDFLKVDLSKQIHQLIDQWQLSKDHRPAVQININIFEPLPSIYADFRQLSQVLLNLVRNGEEMMDAGGKIILEIKQDNDFVQIQVIDDGPGIPDENLDKVFQNFFTTKNQGLGLGLAVCRQIINAHNGKISIRNRTQGGENGTVTCIRLPVKPLATIDKPDFEKILIPA
ncbi:MAG: ATP-binding protein [Deltaproteobacteria bacterium]|nr:ATP-binding protein [Deltaproteobacteria bacterium]